MMELGSRLPSFAKGYGRAQRGNDDCVRWGNHMVSIIKRLEELVLASSGVDAFHEIFKLIYAKLYDEKLRLETGSQLRFFQAETPEMTAIAISLLFEEAKQEWPGVFHLHETFSLSPAHLSVCVAMLQDYQLFDTGLSVLDAAFEYLLPSVAKGNKGQYFTPRHVIAQILQMLQPTGEELLLDPACGSGGFLIHGIQWVLDHDLVDSSLERKLQFIRSNVYGIDFDERAAQISRALMLIAGHGEAHMLSANSLLPLVLPSSLLFDVIVTNPPFGGEIRDPSLLASYALARDSKGHMRAMVPRHILFLERILALLKPGGRAGVIVPQGILNNTNLSYIREWLFEKARVIGVIGLDVNTFKPHTNVKTSILLMQKWSSKPLLDYPIFMAVSKQGGKDKSGNLVYKDGAWESDLEKIAEDFRLFVEEERLGF